ncbi:DASH complex subunit Spc19 [Phaffia rhodozyma]|uniref:DASH complex subunit SPC19 n=1 Tax=Phaffia rhodozyma TaxID=264483 RepID=A0A0F7SG76_PHARH|nr:DASH complex subunit Spc19 [Phaffia rhodozyma]
MSSGGQFLDLLSECVRVTESCVAHEKTSIQILQSAVSDFPRLSHVMENSRRYLFVPEPFVEAQKQRLANEMEPQIDELISRAERGLAVWERREVLKKRKLAQIASNSSSSGATSSSKSSQPKPKPRSRPTAADERKLAMIKGKAERLASEVEELEKELTALDRNDRWD